MKQRTS